jgi:TolB-like protein
MVGLGEIDALERQLRAAIVAFNKKGALNVTLIEAIDGAALWAGSFEDLTPFVQGANLDNLLRRAPTLICAIAAEIGFRFEGVGTQFWAKLADALGVPITMQQRAEIGDAFDVLAAKYKISRPSEGAFSAHFSIISWPIANALLPVDLVGPVNVRLTFSSPAAYSLRLQPAIRSRWRQLRENSNVRYLFEEYAFDTDRRELHRGANVVAIAPQVFDLLDYLIRNRERVVSKDDLIKAIWDGRIVSDAALTTRVNVARSAIGDSGEEQRLIKTLPRKGFRFVGAVREEQRPLSVAVTDIPAEQRKPALPLPDKPSLAVLPFTNLSSDPEQEYFADGMVEDIITGLSRSKSLFVIARHSSFTYRGKAVDIKQVGRELGVRYVLEGSVRKAGNRVRITGQLIDATTGAHLWADRFDSQLEDIFELQDQVTSCVIGAIFPQLERAEIERAKRKPTESLEAYDYYLRALSSFYQFTREQNIEALRLSQAANVIDPEFAAAYAIGAYSYLQRKFFGWRSDAAQECVEARRLVARAIELDKRRSNGARKGRAGDL